MLAFSAGPSPAISVDSICFYTGDSDVIQVQLQHGTPVHVQSLVLANSVLFSNGPNSNSCLPEYLSLPRPMKQPLLLDIVASGAPEVEWQLLAAIDGSPSVSYPAKLKTAASGKKHSFELDRPPPLQPGSRGQLLCCRIVSGNNNEGQGNTDLSFSVWLNAPTSRTDLNASVGPSVPSKPPGNVPFPKAYPSGLSRSANASPGSDARSHSRSASESSRRPLSLDIPDDSPLVRATMDEMETKVISFRKSLKTLLKAAERHLAHLRQTEDVQSELSSALAAVAAADSLRPLMEVYLAPASRLQLQLTKKTQAMTQEMLVEPLKQVIAQLKDLAATKKTYLAEAQVYNEHTSRYLAMSAGTDSVSLARADEKHRAAKQRFATAKLASQQSLKEYALKQNDVLAMLTRWAESAEMLSSSTVDALSPTSQNLATFARIQVADVTEATQRERDQLQDQKEQAFDRGMIGVDLPPEPDRVRRISMGLGISAPTSSVQNLAIFANGANNASRPSLAGSRTPSFHAPPQRRREGFLFASTKPTSNRSDGGGGGTWHRYWVVLSQGQLIEYKEPSADGPMSTSSPPINLKYACVKNSSYLERRFTFEVVTTKSRRVYQADSEAEAEAWKSAIQMQIEALLNGSSSMRTFDTSRIQTFADEAGEHGEKFPSVQSSPNLSSPKQLFSGLVRKASAHKRKGSSPNLLQRGFSNKRLSANSSDLGQLPEASDSQLSFATALESSVATPTSEMPPPPVPFKTSPKLGSPKMWTSDDQEIARAVLALSFKMQSDSPAPTFTTQTPLEQLRGLMNLPGNDVCAECGREPANWASYNIGIFICLQCAGLHRGLGSHISKVRSVELDAWTAAQVEGLEAVGNAKARQFWEATLREEAAKADLGVFVRRKYVDRAWVGKG